jgi:2'-5' RNA ligase
MRFMMRNEKAMLRRVFCALVLPPSARRLWLPYAKRWRRMPWRLVRLADLHITLLFLGDSRPADLATFANVIRTEIAATSPPLVALTHVAFAPERRNMLWWYVRATPDLARLHALLLRAARGGPWETTSRPFTPHVTLARFSHKAREQIQQKISSLPLSVSFRPPALHLLFRLKRTGVKQEIVYETWAQLPFRAAV